MELQQPTASLLVWDKFPDAKESVMKYCSSVAIGDIDAYLYQMGDVLVRHLTWCRWCGSSNGKILISAHLYSTICVLQTLVLGF
jgi:hypothetical protein